MFYLGLLLPLLARESPMRISAPLSRSEEASLLVMVIENTLWVLRRSSRHQGLNSLLVWVQEAWFQLLARFPSMALYAMPGENRDDCVAFPWSARFSPAQRTQLQTSSLTPSFSLGYLHNKMSPICVCSENKLYALLPLAVVRTYGDIWMPVLLNLKHASAASSKVNCVACLDIHAVPDAFCLFRNSLFLQLTFYCLWTFFKTNRYNFAEERSISNRKCVYFALFFFQMNVVQILVQILWLYWK